jgi:hypothetical protein
MIKLFGLRIMTKKQLIKENINFMVEQLDIFPDNTPLVIKRDNDNIYILNTKNM